jgi:hypothetical protein
MKSLFLNKKSLFLAGGGGLLLTLALLLFTTCDVGLGMLVNTEKPVIKNAGDNAPGSFLHGTENKIQLDVSNSLGFKIDTVFIEVEYVDVNDYTTKTKRVDAYKDPVSGEWVVDLDVSDMMDGKIKTWVTAVDESGNVSKSTEMPYTVKNMLPQVKMTIPQVSDDDFDNPALLNSLRTTDIIYQGLDLMGLATDDFQIADGFPKIMFWAKENNDFTVDEDGIPTDNKYGKWRTVELPLNYKSGSTVVKFTYPFADLIEDTSKPIDDPARWRLPARLANGKYGAEFSSLPANKDYRFRLWVRDGFGNDNFYPDRIDNKRGPEGTAADPATAENKFVEVHYKAIGDQAIVQVPDMKQFYNMASDFVVDLVVLSGNGMNETMGAKVEAYICENYDTTGLRCGPYTATKITFGNPYEYKLTIPKADAETWKTGGDYREGRYYLVLQATDEGGAPGPLERKPFDLDLTPPKVDFDQPGALDFKFKSGKITGGEYTILYPSTSGRPKWVTATVTAGGKSTDSYGIDKVYYHVGKHGDDKMTDPQLIAFYNNDNALDSNNNPFWEDTGVGTQKVAEFWGGSVYAWTYTRPYPSSFKSNNSALVQELGDLGFSYSGDNYTTLNKNRFYLPLYVKVVDQAGNKQIVHYKLSIDPDLDDPQINFIYPKAGDIVGGTVRMSGTAEDNIWMHTVLMRIHKEGDSGANYWYLPTTVPPTELFYVSNGSYPKPKPNGSVEDTNGWFKLTGITGEGAVVNWTSTVNGDGKLNPLGDADDVNVTIDVVAIDTTVANGTPRAAGPVETQTVKFSSKVPLIEDIKIIKNKGTSIENSREYTEGISTSGKFVVTMKISAVSGIFKLLAKIDNNSQVTLITNNIPASPDSVWNITEPTSIGDNRVESTLTVTIDSTNASALGGIGYGATGIMNIELTVEDNTQQKFSTTRNFRIGVDNFYPSAVIETSSIASDDIDAKKYFMVQGTAKDWGDNSGALQGLERVLVYFEKAKITYQTQWTGRKVEGTGNYYPVTGGLTTYQNTNNTYFMDYPDVRDTTSSSYSDTNPAPNVTTFRIPLLNTSNTPVKSPTAMVIDYAENDPEQDYDVDGTYGEKWIGLTDKTWEARMLISNPTTKAQQFIDGPYIVHYIVMDTAGNATHYAKDIYVENNKPRILSINVGTDINFDDSVVNWASSSNPGEYRNEAYAIDNSSEARGTREVPNEEFRIRNNRFGIRLTLDKGNGNKTLVVTNVTRGAVANVTAMQRGRIYQIATTAQDTDFTKYGAPNNYANTVFVASGAGTGGGRVYPYNQVTGTTPQTFSLGTGTSITASSTFTNFNNYVIDSMSGLFVIKVYDVTVSTASNGNTAVDPEFDQLSSAILLTVSINNTDNVPPLLEVANFGRRHLTTALGNPQNYTDNTPTTIANAVYSDYVDTAGTTKNGYVQYQAHSTANTGAGSDNPTTNVIGGNGGTANISGKVIFNGKVNDNHRIQRITATIPGYNGGNGVGTEFNIASRNDTSGLLERASYLAGEREFKFVYSNDDVPQYSLAHGQTIVWQFMWDSSKIANVAANNVNIIFRVYDQTNNTTSTKNVNIVPYISEVITPLSKAYGSKPSAFNRSALGGYPVRDGDEITIKGFNLGTYTTNTATTNNVAIGGTTNYVTNIGTGRTNNNITGTVPAVASGPLVVTVNSIASFNNSANKNKTVAYNQEPNGTNNNILDNARYIYIWNTGYIDNTTPGLVYNPFMRLDNSGNRFLSYGYYPSSGNGVLRVRRNNTDIATATANTNRMTNTTISLSVSNNATATNTSWYAAGSDITAGNYPFRFSKSNNAGTGYQDTNNIIAAIGANSNRFKIPRIAVQSTNTNGTVRSDGNADRILLCYYDDDNSRIEVVYGNAGGGANIAAGTTAGGAFPGTAIQVTSGTTTHRGGRYTAVGFLSNGLPLLAWYDEINERLVFSWGSGVATTTTYNALTSRVNTTQGDWQTNAVVIDSVSGRGAHVDMVVDGGNNVHIAYNDLHNGGLYYILIPPNGTGNAMRPNVTKSGIFANNVFPVKVDTFLAAGSKIMINVRQETTPTTRYVPYISYAHGSFRGTRNSVRVAWRTDFATTAPSDGTDDEDSFTGKWEVMTVPAGATPDTDEFICNGVTTNTTWTVPTGSNLNYNTNLNRTIVVGYMTNSHYEGAILRGDIRSVPTELTK